MSEKKSPLHISHIVFDMYLSEVRALYDVWANFREEDLLFHCQTKGKNTHSQSEKLQCHHKRSRERQTARQMSSEISLNKNMFEFQFSIFIRWQFHIVEHLLLFIRVWNVFDNFLATQLSSHCHCRRQETAMRLFILILCDEIGEGSFRCWMRNAGWSSQKFIFDDGYRCFVIKMCTSNVPVENVISIRKREKNAIEWKCFLFAMCRLITLQIDCLKAEKASLKRFMFCLPN